MSKILNNKLILGTVQMGLAYGINNDKGQISLTNSLNILGYAYNNGIEILDTAEAYGNAHEVIGTFHLKNPTKQFKIITKLPNLVNEDLVKKVNRYLNELKVKQIHTLMFHSFASYYSNIENFDVLKRLKSDGKIKHLGVSVYINSEIESVMIDEEIDIIQLPFNLFDNVNLREETLEKAKSKGKIIHTRSALLQGLFFKNPDDSNDTVQKLRNEMGFLKIISEENNASISELALSYCVKQKKIDNVLVGVDSMEQLKENLRAVNYKIEQKTIDSINTIKVHDLDLLNPSLWK